MNTRLFSWMAAALLAAAPLAPAAAAAADDGGPPPKKPAIQLLLGADQWQTDQRYRAGNDWLALVCLKSECRLEPARLTVRKAQWQGRYDDQPTNGQQLSLRRQTPGAGRALAWLRLNPDAPWLRPGPVITYPKKRPDSPGTLEVAVDLPDGRQAAIVPLLDLDKGAEKRNRQPKFLLQLRVPGQRQMLGQIARCGLVISTNYFVWAGDIDGDGKPDYLIDDADGQATLYLSGQAAQGEIAGAAAVYDHDPYCDGAGWLGEFWND